jgi:hypothetical protein
MILWSWIVDAVRYGWGYWLPIMILTVILVVAYRMSRRM